MSAKHTPGPWEFGPNHSSTGLAGQLVVRPAGEFPNGEWVADVGSMYDDHREANARLIAAAPELLEALLVAHKRITEDRASYVWGAELPDGSMDTKDAAILHEAYDSKLAQIEAAIAKATGQEEGQ